MKCVRYFFIRIYFKCMRHKKFNVGVRNRGHVKHINLCFIRAKHENVLVLQS